MPDVSVDSANTTAIEYDSYGPAPWQLIQTGNNGGVFGQTLTRVEGTGGVVFRFHGTQVQVFGSITPPTDAGATATSSYTIDGGQTAAFSSASVELALVSEQDGQLFFDSGTLSDGDHVLVINVTLASTSEPYLLDFIKYAATTATATSSSTTSAAATTSASASATASVGPSHSKNIGPIVGGVVGGVLGFALLLGVGLYFFFRYFRHRISLSGRRRGGREDLVEDLIVDDKPGGSDTGPSGTSTAFRSEPSDASTPWRAGTPVLQLHPPPASSVGPDDSASQVAGRIYAAELAQQRAAGAYAYASSSALAPVSGASGADSHRSRDRKDPLPLPPPVPEEPEAVQHEDSGIRFREGALPVVPPAEVDRIEEEPPEYTPGS
ncbi:hypothetical protein TRAPUB_3782 [Trametes pubescens]|uniref:Transmembrane protein n=1 Tax=Trametes pubescens TaxID=154538 RepID=A0A1M2VCG5_TRAPU|nr:hypothetical protein TRAPUB_3782 [Trametes pubescens]